VCEFESIINSLHRFWNKSENQIQYMEWLSQQLSVQQWQNLPNSEWKKMGARRLMKVCGGKMKMLARVYPTHIWNTLSSFPEHVLQVTPVFSEISSKFLSIDSLLFTPFVATT
jgi:hypothetical protein